jgi:hypothetical protein
MMLLLCVILILMLLLRHSDAPVELRDADAGVELISSNLTGLYAETEMVL